MAEKREIEIKLKSKSAESSADSLNKKVKGIGASADSAEGSMFRLSKVATAVGAALATAQIQRYADAWTNVNNRLNAATSTQAEFLSAQKGVIAIAQQAGVDLAGVADGYSRIAQNTSELGLSQARVLDITKKVTLAIKAGGATAQEAASVIVQLGQGLGAGALQGDELKSIMEASIPITKALAKEFGVTTGELKKLGADGAITADRVVSAIERMDESSLTFTKDISGGFTEVSNALTVYVGSVDESLGITEKITGALSSTAKNLDVVVDGITTLAVLIGAKYVGSLTSAVAAQTALTAAGLRGTIQMNALGQVTARTTVAMNVGAVAAKGLSASLAFIGGPVGVAVIAAAALYSFVDGADAAEKSAKEAADEVNVLAKSFSNLSKNRRATLLNETEKEMADLSSQLVIANNQLNQLKGFADSPIKAQGIRQVESQIDSLNQKMDTLSNKQAALIGSPDLSGGTDRGNINDEVAPTSKTPTDTSSNKAFESLKARLKLETQAIQEEAEVRRAFAEGLINQQQLDEELALQNVFYNYEARRVAITENEKLNKDQKAVLLAELAQQEIDAEQIKQDQLTEKTQQGADERVAVAQQESAAIRSMIIDTAVAAFNLTQNSNAKMTKEQKSQAKKSIYIQTAAAIARAYGENNFYVASGMALFLAGMQLKQLGAVESAGASTSLNTNITPQQQAPSVENQSQSRVINITGLDGFGDDQPIPLTVGGLRDLLSSNEDVNIAINNGQQNAARIGAI